MIFDILLIRKLSNPPHVHVTLNKTVIFTPINSVYCLLNFCVPQMVFFSQLKSGSNNSEMYLNNMLHCTCERAFSVTFYNEKF